MKLCIKCNASLNEKAKFCTNCGTEQPVEPTGTSSEKNALRCSKCGANIRKGAKFCTSCGTAVPTEPIKATPSNEISAPRCSKCGAPIRSGAKFCTKCGASQIATATATKLEGNKQSSIIQQARIFAENRQNTVNNKPKPVSPLSAATQALNTQPTQIQKQVQGQKKETKQDSPLTPPPIVNPLRQANTETKPKGSLLSLLLGILLPLLLLGGGGTAAYFLLSKPKVKDFLNKNKQYQKIVDSRDNQEYHVIPIGTQEWIAQNINYATPNSICDTCELYGRLYTYDEAMNACPEGFTIPTKRDVDELFSNANASALISQKLGGTDDYGFSSIMAGFLSLKEQTIKRRGEILDFWMYDETDKLALRAKINNVAMDTEINPLEKHYGFSVRCIKTSSSKRDESTKLLIDNRNRRIYNTRIIGSHRWMEQNLNYRTKKSFCYYNDSVFCNLYGRLYTFESALNACPEGWHLPDSATIAELQTWHPQYGGYRNPKGDYEFAEERAMFWTEFEKSWQGIYWYLSKNDTRIRYASSSKKSAMSVRCVEYTEEELEDIQAEKEREALETADREALERKAEEARMAEEERKASEELERTRQAKPVETEERYEEYHPLKKKNIPTRNLPSDDDIEEIGPSD